MKHKHTPVLNVQIGKIKCFLYTLTYLKTNSEGNWVKNISPFGPCTLFDFSIYVLSRRALFTHIHPINWNSPIRQWPIICSPMGSSPIWTFTNMVICPNVHAFLRIFNNMDVHPYWHSPIWTLPHMAVHPYGMLTHIDVHPYRTITRLGLSPIWEVLLYGSVTYMAPVFRRPITKGSWAGLLPVTACIASKKGIEKDMIEKYLKNH